MSAERLKEAGDEVEVNDVNWQVYRDRFMGLRFKTGQGHRSQLAASLTRDLGKKLKDSAYGDKMLEIIVRDLGSFTYAGEANRFIKSLVENEDARMFQIMVDAYDDVEDPRELLLLGASVREPIPIDAVGEDLNAISTFVNYYKRAIDMDLIVGFTEASKYALAGGYFRQWNAATKVNPSMPYTFPIVLGPLPIAHVQEIEIARSGKILKFRATGSVFLANQEGGEDAIRIECLVLPDEHITIMFLWLLFIFGRGRAKEADLDATGVQALTINQLRTKIAEISTTNPALAKPSYEFHNTFPLVTRHIIMTNVYIETLSIEDRVVDGKDVLKVSILLRTYVKPRTFVKHKIPEGNVIYGPTIDNKLRMFKVIEFAANAAWRYYSSEGFVFGDVRLFNEQSFKTGPDSLQSDDVYYNINAEDVAYSVAFGLFGMI